MLSTADGQPLEIPAEVVITAVMPPSATNAAAEPVSAKEAKHVAEVECQRTNKVQRLALEAVRAAEQDVEHARQRMAAKENLLAEAKAALATASSDAEAALLAFNDASRAYQAEVARAAAPSAEPAKTGAAAGGAGSRSSSREQKRPAPAERTEVSVVWDALKNDVRDALASGDQAAAQQATQRHMDEIIRLQQQELDAAARNLPAARGSAGATGDGAPASKRVNSGTSPMDVERAATDGPAASGAASNPAGDGAPNGLGGTGAPASGGAGGASPARQPVEPDALDADGLLRS